MKSVRSIRSLLLPAALFLTTQSQALEVQVKVKNLSPEGGLYFTPVWVGFHDGSFDIYDQGDPTPPLKAWNALQKTVILLL